MPPPNLAKPPPPAAVPPPEPGISVRELLDQLSNMQRANDARLDSMEERASRERRDQAAAFNGRIEDEARHAQEAAKALVHALSAVVNNRIGDLRDEQASARKENRWLMMLMIVGILGLGGLNVALDADGGIEVSQPEDAYEDEAPAPG